MMAKGRCSCPDNCTVKTYYDEDAIVCLACPDGTFTDGVGAVNCTAVAVTSPVTTTQTTTATPETCDKTPIYDQDKILADYFISESAKRRFCLPSSFHSALNETAVVIHGLSEVHPSAVGWWARFDSKIWDCAQHTFRLGVTLLEGTNLKRTSLLVTQQRVRGGRLVKLPSARLVYEADFARRGGSRIASGVKKEVQMSACSGAVGGPNGQINANSVWPDEL